MKIYAIPGLERYKKIFQRVAQKYLEHLNHRSLMAGKLSDMLVVLGYGEEDIPTHGTVELNYLNNHVVHRMNIRINQKDSDKQIAAIMAHELAHVLFAFTYDYFCFGGESQSGCESAKSSFQRKDSTTKEEFGVGLEEGAAEVLARYIVSLCRFSDAEGTYAKEKAPDTYYSMLAELTESLANCFGSSVYNSEYIDGLSIDKYIVDKDHPLYEEMEDTYDEDLWVTNRHFYRHSIANPFWYSAVTNTFHCTIDEYDKYMEKGAFRELCKHFDSLYYQYYEHSEEDNAYDIALEHKRNAQEMIRAFEEKYKSRPLEQPNGIEAKYEQYVEEQKKTADRV